MSLLGFYDENMDYVVEPGKVKVFIGSSSEDIRQTGEFEIVGAKKKIQNKVFFSETKVEFL